LPGCVGEVDPGIEDCSNSIDENCDGTFCTQSLWSHDYGDANDDTPYDIAVDSSGNSFVVGKFYGTLALGNLPPLSENVGNADAFLFKLDVGGVPSTAFQYGDAALQIAEGVAIDSAGNSIVVGSFKGGMIVGGTLLGGAGNSGSQGFVLKLNSAGAPIWLKTLGTQGKGTYSHGVAVDSSDNIYVVGDFNSATDFGTGVMTPVTGAPDGYLLMLDSAGVAKRVAHFGAAGQATTAKRVATDSFGGVAISGDFYGTVSFGANISVVGNGHGAFPSDSFVAKYDKLGSPIFAKSVGNGNATWPNNVADIKLNSAGDVIAVGGFNGNLHPAWWAQCPAVTTPAGVTANSFIVRMGAADGTCKAAKQFGNTAAGNGPTAISRIAVDPSNNAVFVAGACYGVFDIGTNLSCGGVSSPFVLKTDSAFTTVWARSYGASGGGVAAISLAPQATVRVVVTNAGSIDFGNGALISSGGNDIAVAAIVTQ
jgi:hypothetical protein